MNIKEYEEKALSTRNKELTKEQILINGVMGLCGESGEVIDIIKKHLYHGKDLDSEHIVDELGDVLWYITSTANSIGSSLEEVMNKNIEKLNKRYPKGFTPASGHKIFIPQVNEICRYTLKNNDGDIVVSALVRILDVNAEKGDCKFKILQVDVDHSGNSFYGSAVEHAWDISGSIKYLKRISSCIFYKTKRVTKKEKLEALAKRDKFFNEVDNMMLAAKTLEDGSVEIPFKDLKLNN